MIDTRSFSGSIKPSSIEQSAFEATLGASRIVEIPSNLHKKIDYAGRTDSNPVYVGANDRGTATSDTSWLLQKITYDASDRVIDVSIAYDSWDNRVTATYS